MADHPVKVPVELRAQWRQDAPRYRDGGVGREDWLMDRAAQWGWDQREHEVQEQADQELEGCCAWLRSHDILEPAIDALRAARRPKPPTLAERGCNALDAYIYGNPDHGDKQNTYNTIRAALNRLAELEAQQ